MKGKWVAKWAPLPSMTTLTPTFSKALYIGQVQSEIDQLQQWLKAAEEHMKYERAYTPEIAAFDQYMAAIKRYEEEKKEAEKKRREEMFCGAVFTVPLAPIELNMKVKRVGDTVIVCQSPREHVIMINEMDPFVVRVAESVLE